MNSVIKLAKDTGRIMLVTNEIENGIVNKDFADRAIKD